MQFARPEVFWLLIPVALLFFFWWWKGERRKVLGVSSRHIVVRPSFLQRSSYHIRKPIWWAIVAVVLLGVAGPYGREVMEFLTTQGRIFVLSIDLSTSMSYSSYSWYNPYGGETPRLQPPTPIDYVKQYSLEFIRKRKSGEDLIGVTAYGGDGFPSRGRAAVFLYPSSNLKEAQEAVLLLRPGMLGSHTSVGEGIWVSSLALLDRELKGVDRDLLKKSIESYGGVSTKPEYAIRIAKRLGKVKQRNKVITIFTDGLNNRGIEPVKILWWVSEVGIKVYFIAFAPGGATGIGSQEEARLLKDNLILGVKKTGGEYYESADVRNTQKFFEEVNRIERSAVDVDVKTKMLSAYGLLAAFGLLFSLSLYALECLARRHV